MRTAHSRYADTARLAGMLFAPEVDPRLAAGVGRIPDISCSARVWRALRRRAQRLHAATPCYESVRKLVLAERERRARLLAAVTTLAEVMMRRTHAVPTDVGWICVRNLRRSRARLRCGHVPLPP